MRHSDKCVSSVAYISEKKFKDDSNLEEIHECSVPPIDTSIEINYLRLIQKKLFQGRPYLFFEKWEDLKHEWLE